LFSLSSILDGQHEYDVPPPQVKDILGTGTAPRLEALKNDPMVRTLFEFGSVWGIGPVTARKLYDMGYRTLEELEGEPSLTSAQRTGVRFFYDIQQRIPRHEVRDVELAKDGRLRLKSSSMFASFALSPSSRFESFLALIHCAQHGHS
jgi:nucleotidyltransferase/DNA polymerase involved in DNA repair